MLERELGRFVKKRQLEIEKVYRKPYNKLMKGDHFERNISTLKRNIRLSGQLKLLLDRLSKILIVKGFLLWEKVLHYMLRLALQLFFLLARHCRFGTCSKFIKDEYQNPKED